MRTWRQQLALELMTEDEERRAERVARSVLRRTGPTMPAGRLADAARQVAEEYAVRLTRAVVLGHYDPRLPARPYQNRILERAIADARRKLWAEAKQVQLSVLRGGEEGGAYEPADPQVNSVDAGLLADERAEALARLLRALDEESRQMLEMKYVEGQSQDEIARTLGYSRAKVNMKLHRARKKLRDQLESSV